MWLPTGQLIQMAVKSVFDVNNYVWTENVVTSPASEARLVCMADSSEILENPFGKGQLAVRCIWIGQCAPSGELDVFRDHWSQKGG